MRGRDQGGPHRGFAGADGVSFLINYMVGTCSLYTSFYEFILHQLRQRRELLPSIQVVEIPRVLDPNVGHLIPHPAGHRAEVTPVDTRAEVGTAWGMGGGPGQGAHTGAGWTHTGPGRAGAWATRVRGQVLAPARASGHPPDGEGEVALVLATGPSQEAPVDPSALEQGLGIQPTEVSVKPPGRPGGQ